MEKFIKVLFSFLLIVIPVLSQDLEGKTIFKLGKFSERKINKILKEASKLKTREEKIKFISSKFLNLPYKPIKLGFKTDEEFFVVQLEGVDCMTFVEYVECMVNSTNFQEFVNRLRKFRYQNGIIEYKTRNHFFTDWIEFNGYKDIGRYIGGDKAVLVRKSLNFSKSKGIILKDVPIRSRMFYYIPSDKIDDEIKAKLKTGDIVGAYAYKPEQDWLDVTHLGYIIRKDGKVYFRNASSLKKYNRVVDIPLDNYLKRVKGLVILRKVEQ